MTTNQPKSSLNSYSSDAQQEIRRNVLDLLNISLTKSSFDILKRFGRHKELQNAIIISLYDLVEIANETDPGRRPEYKSPVSIKKDFDHRNQDEFYLGIKVYISNFDKDQNHLQLFNFSNNLTQIIPKSDDFSEDLVISKVFKIIEENYTNENFCLQDLCHKIGLSRSQLYRKTKAYKNVSPSKLLRKYRLNKGKKLLSTTALNVSEISWSVGFKDPAHFSKSFLEEFGITPSSERRIRSQ